MNTLNKTLLIGTVTLSLTMVSINVFASGTDITVHKDPNCGCCENYISYLKANGFNVTVINEKDMNAVKKRLGTGEAESCHTAEIGNYVAEGHVPVATLKKMLTERPDIKGIALPGMPETSPGMGEAKSGSLKILAINKQGKPAGVYAVE